MAKFTLDLIESIQKIPDSKTQNLGHLLKTYSPHLKEISENLYEKLCKADQAKFITWFLKRWSNIDIVNPIEIHLLQNEIAHQPSDFKTIEINNKSFHLHNYLIGNIPVSWIQYPWCGPANRFHFEQYTHKSCPISSGDVIIDAGGFIGDTAIIFNNQAKGNCTIHSFEVYEENVHLMSLNFEINKTESNVIINKFALSNKTGNVVKINNPGLEGAIYISEEGGEDITTITIDDYVLISNTSRVDFIKMDIEGSELVALEGAINTIKHFKPKLAICIYHKPEDVISIPKFIKSTGVDYNLYFKWELVSEGGEAVLFAVPS